MYLSLYNCTCISHMYQLRSNLCVTALQCTIPTPPDDAERGSSCTTPEIPVLQEVLQAVNGGGGGGPMTAVRTSAGGGGGVAGMVPPPGTKMVPVKLVTVGSAENNMRLVRVSPVKTSPGVTEVSVGSTVVMQRDVVVKPTPSTVMQVF